MTSCEDRDGSKVRAFLEPFGIRRIVKHRRLKLKHRKWIFLVLVALACCRALCQSCGYLQNATGSISVSGRNAKSRMLRRFDRVYPGDILSTGKNSATTLLLFANGTEYSLAAGCRARIGAKQVDVQSGPTVKVVPSRGRQLLARIAASKQPDAPVGGTIVRGSDGSLVLTPNGACFSPITLAWTGNTHCDAFEVAIYRDGRAVAENELKADARSCAIPDGLLTAGASYSWTLSLKKGGQTVRTQSARLRPLDSHVKTDFDHLRRLAESGEISWETLGMGYEIVGLTRDALEAYQTEQKVRPDKDLRQKIRTLSLMLHS